MLASDVFNREFKKISAAWVKQPVPLTLAGIPPTPEPESTLVGPEVQKDDGAGGQLPGRRRRGASLDLVGEATRLIAIRNALRDAEAGAAARDFHQTKRAELEREVVTVPADELESWFEKESTP